LEGEREEREGAKTAAKKRRGRVARSWIRGLTLLTHNRAHFEALARLWPASGRAQAGILVAVRRPVHDMARRLFSLPNTVTADEMENQLRYC
jgi:hypothetical protein